MGSSIIQNRSSSLNMSQLRVTIKDDNGRDCVIENIRTFQKHLVMFHKTYVIFMKNKEKRYEI